MGRVFANGPRDISSIPGRVILKTLKMVLDTSLLNTQQYKVHIKNKVEQSRGRSSALPYTLVLKLLKREPSGRPQLRSPTLLTYLVGCPRGVMIKAMNCGIVVCEFVLQSRYYVHFRANTLGKGMNPLILPPAMGK